MPNQQKHSSRPAPAWVRRWLPVLAGIVLLGAGWLAWDAWQISKLRASRPVVTPAPAPQPPTPQVSVPPPTGAMVVPLVTLDAAGVVKVNGVVPVARAGGQPPLGLERAVLLKEWTDEKGRHRHLWADRDLGIVAETVRQPGSDVPQMLALEMGAQGARTVPGLRFRGVLDVLGQRVDFSQPQQHGSADLERLRQPGITYWQWGRERRLLDFAIGDAQVSLMLSPKADAVVGLLLVPAGSAR